MRRVSERRVARDRLPFASANVVLGDDEHGSRHSHGGLGRARDRRHVDVQQILEGQPLQFLRGALRGDVHGPGQGEPSGSRQIETV